MLRRLKTGHRPYDGYYGISLCRSGGQAGGQIRGPWSRRRYTYSGYARHSADGRGDEGGILLMPADDELDIRMVRQFIEDGYLYGYTRVLLEWAFLAHHAFQKHHKQREPSFEDLIIENHRPLCHNTTQPKAFD